MIEDVRYLPVGCWGCCSRHWRMFCVLVERQHCCQSLISEFIVTQRSTVINDRLAIALLIDSNQYTHQTVNHSYNFVDFSALVHTQNIENMWMCMKRKKEAEMGKHVSLLGTHLIEFMRRQQFGERPFENLVRCI